MKTGTESVVELQALLAKRDSEIASLNRQVEWLTQQLCLMRGRRFGASSEKTTVLFDQTSLFNEAETNADPSVSEPELESVVYRRRKRVGKREADLALFPTEQVIHDLPEDERVCPECGGRLHECGHETLRRELVYVPAQYKVREHIQVAYSCRCCERTSDHVPMKTGTVPAPLIPGSGVASPSLAAHILNSKYTLALPLYRQEQEFARLGVPISRQTMSNWVVFIHKQYFKGLADAMHRELLKNEILHADETTLTVLREDGRKAQQKSYAWVYRTSGDTEKPIVLYDYQPSRSGDCANRFLEGFSGLLHTDGYEAYHCKLPEEVVCVGCWAHMRRKFSDALKILPKDIRRRSPAQTGFAFCNRLFKLEEDYEKRSLSFEERYKARIDRSVPLAQEFFAWVKKEQEKNPTPKSVFGAALTYAINQESWLMNVFLDGRLELSNNRAERSVRPFALGRKNWLFCNTPAGADASAVMYSIVETAKLNGLKPFAYFEFLLDRLPQGYPVEKCLPWGESAQFLCK